MWIVEECHLPIVLLETFREFIEVRLNQPRDILSTNQGLRWCWVLFDQDLLEEHLNASGTGLILLYTRHVDHEDETSLETSLVDFWFLYLVGCIVWLGRLVWMDLLEEESEHECTLLRHLSLGSRVALVLLIIYAPELASHDRELKEKFQPRQPLLKQVLVTLLLRLCQCETSYVD